MTSLPGMERWAGKTAVVTGAGSGIGAGVAAALAAAGMRVVAVDRKEEAAITEALNQLKCTSNVTARQCDVSDLSQLGETFRWLDQHHGGVSVLVSSAGMLLPGQITDVGLNPLDEEVLCQTLDVNTTAVVMCAKHAVACMKRHGIDGHIININSLAGHYIPFNSDMNVYSASKYAITAFTQALKQELAHFKSKIKVTSISPGAVSSNMASKMLDVLDKDRNARPALKPADIAHAVLYALSTPPNVNVNELTITSVTETRL
ncbi:farnesol dehydrogenase-like [Choristoneura fumiferana]|uniref:farnesol dehydrogenase-like n=1 Tax=Choristoneura fumiferana TaxID=7141 RepID=UPI003D15E40B